MLRGGEVAQWPGVLIALALVLALPAQHKVMLSMTELQGIWCLWPLGHLHACIYHP